MGCAAAAENSNQTDLKVVSASDNMWNSTNSSNTNSTSNFTDSASNAENFNQSSDSSNTTAEILDEACGCCSVLLHVRDGYDVFSYRRDSTYAATLYFQESTWYGKKAIKEYKTVNGYFFHTIVTLDGWIVSMGGPDIVSVVRQIESLAGSTAVSGSITSSTINRAVSLIASMGMGHFLIKSPSNVVGYAIVNGGSKSGLFTLGNGQYVSVPNSPSCYRSGYISTSTPVASAISLALNNPWGVNHRDIISYEIVETSDVFNYITKVNIYASKSLSSDNIVFRGKFISGSSLPSAIGKRYLGQVVRKISRPTTSFGYQNMVYTYSDILAIYSATGALPGSVGVGPWMVTVGDVIDAAGQVITYVDNKHKLPSSVTVNGITVSTSTFLRLLTSTIVLINGNNLTTLLNPKGYGAAPSPKDTMSTGNLSKSDYLSIAQNVKKFMDAYGRAPNFAVNSAYKAYVTTLGTCFGYQNMIYTYSKILNTYNTTGTLPNTIEIKPWRFISANNAKSFTPIQIIDGACEVKKYVEINHQLPAAVTITGEKVSMASFLELLTTTVLQIYNSDLQTPVDSISFISAPDPQDSMTTGNLALNKYVDIALNVKRFMDIYGRAPNFAVNSANKAYTTSVGTYFGYQNMIYTFCKILNTYNITGTLPNTIEIKPWSKIVNDPKINTFTVEETLKTAIWVQEYIETYQKLPEYVTINGIDVNMPTFLKLITTMTQKIYHNDLTPTNLTNNYKSPASPKDNQKTGTISLTTYISIAGKIQRYMDQYKIAPNYSSYSTLGTYFGYQNLIYTYSKILNTYNTTGSLPAKINVVSWSFVVNFAGTFTINQTIEAASWTQKYIETNKKLPNNATINGTNLRGETITTTLTMPTFLKLITTITQKINNKNLTPTNLTNNYKSPASPKDNQKTGTISLTTYISIAGKIQRYMDQYKIAPNYSSYSTLGTYFGYQNMIYTYSKILNTYNTTKTMPVTIKIVPWNLIVNYAGTFTINQTIEAASWTQKYIETNKKLPNNVTINGTNLRGETITTTLTMPTFLKLITTITQKIYNKDTKPIDLLDNYKTATSSRDNQKTGTISLTTYISIAGKIQRYMDQYKIAPNYSSYSTLGTYFGYQNMIYTYSKILNTYNTTKTMPSSVNVGPWMITVEQVTGTTGEVIDYIEINHKLPSSVTINGIVVSIPTYLKLLTTSVTQINSTNLTTLLNPRSYGTANAPRDTMNTGEMERSEYIDIARRIKDYMDRSGVAPNYSSYSTLGTYFGYQNMIYTYSKILNTYNTTGSLPENVTVGPWMVTVKQVVAAAKVVKSYVDNNNQMPSSVRVGGIVVSIPTFLKLLTTSVIQINKKDLNTLLNPQSYGAPSRAKDKMRTRKMTKSEYIFIASKVKNYMNSKGRAPGYATALR